MDDNFTAALETVSPARYSITEELNQFGLRESGIGSRGFPNIVERADMRMVQRGDGARFALEPRTEIGISGDM